MGCFLVLTFFPLCIAPPQSQPRQSFDELPKGPIPETVCDKIVGGVLEGKATERPARVELLRILAREKKLPQAALESALYPMIEFIPDIALDAPKAEA